METASISNDRQLRVCPHCDHVVAIPELADGERARCPVCDTPLSLGFSQRAQHIVAFSLTGLVLFLCSLNFEFLSFANQGFSQSIQLLDTGSMLFEYQYPELGVLVDLTIIGLPFLHLTLLMILHAGGLHWLPHAIGKRMLKFTIGLEPWLMSEIFLIAVIVSLVKITSMAEVGLGWSFWSFCGFVLCSVYCLSLFDKHELWQQIAPPQPLSKAAQFGRAIDAQLSACHQCGVLTEEAYCPRCHTATQLRDPFSLQKVLAFTVTSLVCYLPANLLPIMSTSTLTGGETPSTIIGGVLTLWQLQSYPIAIIIFVASVLVPLIKLLLLFWLSYCVWRPNQSGPILHTGLYRLIEFVGKWSMLDVFVVAILVALIQLGGVMTVLPGAGALFFAGTVILSMLAAHAFDPRLLWDNHLENKHG